MTADVRAMIGEFARANAPRLQTWIDAVARKDPGRAAELFLRALEYHVPKLARCELAELPADPRAPGVNLMDLTSEQLSEIVLDANPRLRRRAQEMIAANHGSQMGERD